MYDLVLGIHWQIYANNSVCKFEGALWNVGKSLIFDTANSISAKVHFPSRTENFLHTPSQEYKRIEKEVTNRQRQNGRKVGSSWNLSNKDSRSGEKEETFNLTVPFMKELFRWSIKDFLGLEIARWLWCLLGIIYWRVDKLATSRIF